MLTNLKAKKSSAQGAKVQNGIAFQLMVIFMEAFIRISAWIVAMSLLKKDKTR